MKHYPSIEYWNKGLLGADCIAFDKLDGSSMRFEWNNKRGFYKFGTKNVMINNKDSQFGEGIGIFLDKYGYDLENIFLSEYKKVINFVVFAEFFGENSFAGQHVDTDKKNIVIFDISQYKRGLIDPYEFIDNFGHLDIPDIIYQGIYSKDFINNVKQNKYNLDEGVVVKGIIPNRSEPWMVKVKTNLWLQKVKEKFGEKYLISELNNDKELIKNYEQI